jgi:hypothetical protein
VKAFNTMAAEVIALDREALAHHRVSVFLCSDDAPAKAVVRGLDEELGFVGAHPTPCHSRTRPRCRQRRTRTPGRDPPIRQLLRARCEKALLHTIRERCPSSATGEGVAIAPKAVLLRVQPYAAGTRYPAESSPRLSRGWAESTAALASGATSRQRDPTTS